MENKEHEFAKQVEIIVRKISVKLDRGGEFVEKIIFESDKGNITFKPKIERIEWRKGIEVISSSQAKFDELPDKLSQFSTIANEKGFVKLIASYTVWNTEKDGSPVTYRYIPGMKSFDEWKIVPVTPVVTESVGERG